MISAITVAIDRSGRLVVPKAVREESGIEPGQPLSIRVRDGRIEIEPVYVDVELVERDGFQVAERAAGSPDDTDPGAPGGPLTNDEVRATQAEVRSRGRRG